NRDAVLLSEGSEFGGCLGVMHATTGNDDGTLGRFDHLGCARELAAGGARTARLVKARLKKAGWIIIGFALGVLTQRQEGRAAFAWIEHDGYRLRQGLQDLLGSRDTIPIARNSPEAVGD